MEGGDRAPPVQPGAQVKNRKRIFGEVYPSSTCMPRGNSESDHLRPHDPRIPNPSPSDPPPLVFMLDNRRSSPLVSFPRENSSLA
ncbi:hypothetical protein TL16_g00898 [Triparma laevis f. inornata]|uniref:Uncharacterized protein n=1 Tax=Triparma laevis f. inornata TaxID=1714386 RepID=A0A9W6ZII7_9STRA|nr:hypothetical protein TL16_g00898 [Triparma laevis f. inornata]